MRFRFRATGAAQAEASAGNALLTREGALYARALVEEPALLTALLQACVQGSRAAPREHEATVLQLMRVLESLSAARGGSDLCAS